MEKILSLEALAPQYGKMNDTQGVNGLSELAAFPASRRKKLADRSTYGAHRVDKRSLFD